MLSVAHIYNHSDPVLNSMLHIKDKSRSDNARQIQQATLNVPPIQSI